MGYVEKSLGSLLDEARRKISRLEPQEAFAAAQAGALIVDIRGDNARMRDGVVPGALHVPRTVLEWRFAPDSEWRNREVGGHERRVIVLCDHGYSSSLAAASLVDLGFSRAAEVIGGFDAWRAAGLPVARLRQRTDGGLPGMGPLD
jgi:rhodanese-related sulfurtransferase